MNRHLLAEERSIAMHRAVAAKLLEDPHVLERARDRVQKWRTTKAVHEDYVRGWEALLGLPLEQLCDALVDPGEPARALRQVSPFAGALDARQRWAIYRATQP